MGSRARAAPERRRDSRLASLATQNGALAFYTLGGARPGAGGTPLQEPNGDVPLDGVAFSRLE